MKFVRLVLALLFGGRFIAACEDGGHHWRSPGGPDRHEPFADGQSFGDEDDEGW